MNQIPPDLGHNLLFALNDTAESLQTVRVVSRELPEPAHTRLTLMHYLMPVFWEHGGFDPRTVEMLEERAWQAEEREVQTTEQFFARVIALLTAGGVPANQIRTKETWDARDVASAILTELQQGAYTTAIIGRHHDDTLSHLLNRSLADVLSQHAPQTQVWVVDTVPTEEA